jgi:hypothetical protein
MGTLCPFFSGNHTTDKYVIGQNESLSTTFQAIDSNLEDGTIKVLVRLFAISHHSLSFSQTILLSTMRFYAKLSQLLKVYHSSNLRTSLIKDRAIRWEVA